MIKRTTALTAALLTALALTFAAGSAVAGDGKSCGDKKKDGASAAVSVPAQPLA
jgi:hypothetical protein